MNERPLRHDADLVDLGTLMQPDVVDELTKSVPRITTGFVPLDGALEGGIQAEELVVVAGQPGIGKTVAMVQWLRHLAVGGIECGIASYEHRELAILAQLLLIEVGELPGDSDSIEKAEARRVVAALAGGHIRWTDAVEQDELVSSAAERLQTYAPNIHVLTIRSLKRGFTALVDAVRDTLAMDVLFVDHIQKVPNEDPNNQMRVAAQLKALAVEFQIAVIAASPIGDSGLSARRLRLEHLRDAAAVTHEADVVIVLNDKLGAVSRAHSAFDPLRQKGFRRQTIFSIEKNRRGMSGVDIEFERDFTHRRFDPQGSFVTDTLVDGVIVRE